MKRDIYIVTIKELFAGQFGHIIRTLTWLSFIV